ncbi:hypothetical protein K2173_021524 [Erythroxylum novogranatense]|uniref:Uncharacterized protein n=1 Tax=Erythroxylum novogranatense TaxID=1862640 RepID=A0AAV8TN62_9ROSI|nr:hypothetical protein K2173_021524 [Erythroxylum novogranatense]
MVGRPIPLPPLPSPCPPCPSGAKSRCSGPWVSTISAGVWATAGPLGFGLTTGSVQTFVSSIFLALRSLLPMFNEMWPVIPPSPVSGIGGLSGPIFHKASYLTLPPPLHRHTTIGSFSTASAHTALCSSDWNPVDAHWSHVWHWKGPAHIQTFIWLLMHEALLTNQTRRRRHLTESEACFYCGQDESALHVVRDCPRSRALWMRLHCHLPLAFWSALTNIAPPLWLPLPTNWVRLDTDGAVTTLGTQAAVGGVLRDHSGHWLMGFTHNVGPCTPLDAEFWGILHRLTLARCLGYTLVQLHSDYKVAVDLLTSDGDDHWGNTILCHIRLLLDQHWHVDIQHVYREHNGLVDAFAKLGFNYPSGLHILPAPPRQVERWLSPEPSPL